MTRVSPRTNQRTLLSTLDEAERWISNAADPVRALTNVACLVGNQLHCNACSIYLRDPVSDQLVLCGTVGLRQDCVGRIQMPASEGLTGLVAEERRPVVVLSHASSHSRFRYFPEAGEDLYDSFVGVPILDRATLIGVLVVQTFEPANLSNEDIRKLVDIGRGLGPLLAAIRAKTLEELTQTASAV